MLEIEETCQFEVNPISVGVRKVDKQGMHYNWEKDNKVKTERDCNNPTTVHEIVN